GRPGPARRRGHLGRAPSRRVRAGPHPRCSVSAARRARQRAGPTPETSPDRRLLPRALLRAGPPGGGAAPGRGVQGAAAGRRDARVAPGRSASRRRRRVTTMKTLLILNDPAYRTERSYNGLRLAGAPRPNPTP